MTIVPKTQTYRCADELCGRVERTERTINKWMTRLTVTALKNVTGRAAGGLLISWIPEADTVDMAWLSVLMHGWSTMTSSVSCGLHSLAFRACSESPMCLPNWPRTRLNLALSLYIQTARRGRRPRSKSGKQTKVLSGSIQSNSHIRDENQR